MRLKPIAIALRLLPSLALIVLLGSCGKRGEQKQEYPWVGIYVSEGYTQRAQGADWGAISIDSAGDVRIRYRSDVFYPECNTDWSCALPIHDKYGIDLGFAYLRGDTLEISEEFRPCTESVQQDNYFIRLREPLDDSQLIPVLPYHDIKYDSRGAFDIRQEGRSLIIKGRNSLCDTIELGRRFVEYQFVDDLSSDGKLDLIIALNTFTGLGGKPVYPTLLVYSQGIDGELELIEVEDYAQTPHALGAGSVSWASIDSGNLQIEFPLIGKECQGTPYKRVLKYKLTEGKTPDKKLVIVSAEDMEDERCWH